VEKHQLERQLLGTPPCALGLEANVAVLVVRKFLQFLREVDVRLLVRLRGKLPRALRDVVETERRAKRRQQKSDDRERNGSRTRADPARQKQMRPPKWRPNPPAQIDGPQYAYGRGPQ
jgi:hypothetical protein